jgi:uncharacterized protein YcbK (DUF882 family)
MNELSEAFTTQLSEHFTSQEFACKCGCGFDDVSLELIHLLESIREEYGKPMRITSGCRCRNWNSQCGGVSRSAHLRGTAADIYIDNGADRRRLVDCGVMLFASGIGVARTFIHFDVCDILPRPSLWSY